MTKDKEPFCTQIPVLIEHINYGNHLGHDSLISLLHEARIRFLKSFGAEEKNMIMVELHVEYLSEAFHGDILTISIHVDKLKSASCRFNSCVKELSSNRLIAKAAMTLAFFDYEKRKVIKIPESFINSLQS